MTINEFRAWLDGFKEAIGAAPTPEQWAKVLEKTETLDPLHVFRGLNVPPAPKVQIGGGSIHVPHDPSIRVNN